MELGDLEKILLSLIKEGDLIERDGVFAEVTERIGDFIYDDKGGETHVSNLSSFTLFGPDYSIEFDRNPYLEDETDFEGEDDDDFPKP